MSPIIEKCAAEYAIRHIRETEPNEEIRERLVRQLDTSDTFRKVSMISRMGVFE